MTEPDDIVFPKGAWMLHSEFVSPSPGNAVTLCWPEPLPQLRSCECRRNWELDTGDNLRAEPIVTKAYSESSARAIQVQNNEKSNNNIVACSDGSWRQYFMWSKPCCKNTNFQNEAWPYKTSWCHNYCEKLVKNSLYGMTEMLESLVKIKPEISTVVSKYNENKPSADQVKFPSELEWDIIN